MGDIHRVDRAPGMSQLGKAAITSVSLSALFVVVYGFTNWLTAQRHADDVGTWYLDWEVSFVPFVPALIIPYLSIDLFFFGAAFRCRGDRERTVFVKRVVFSILIATTFFLLMPLRLVWPARPEVAGWFGEVVEASCTAPFLMEYPHNLFPSLHVALCAILAELYARHARGLLRILLQCWFVLVTISTVLTWQHHLVDVAGGIVLAAFAFYLFPDYPSRQPVTPHCRLGLYYGIGALFLSALALGTQPWGVFLLWPAGSLALVAGAYWGGGAGVFRKAHGTLSYSTRVVHTFVLFGQYVSLRYYRRHARAWNCVYPDLYIGGRLSQREAEELVALGVKSVLDLTAEFSEVPRLRALNYHQVPILDLTGPTPKQLQEAVDFLTEATFQGPLYVHCKIGYSRTAAVVGAYLLASGQARTASDAVRLLRESRPTIIVRAEAMDALLQFERGLRAAAVSSQQPGRRLVAALHA